MITKKMSIFDYRGRAVPIDCPVDDGYIYIITIVSGDEVLDIWNGEQLVATFDSSHDRLEGFFDNLFVYTSFESLVNRIKQY